MNDWRGGGSIKRGEESCRAGTLINGNWPLGSAMLSRESAEVLGDTSVQLQGVAT